MRRATKPTRHIQPERHISIHALHEESDAAVGYGHGLIHDISIHALHEESDYDYMPFCQAVCISIHALHEESDLILGNHDDVLYGFQSTLSMRRATVQLDIFVRFLRRKPAA